MSDNQIVVKIPYSPRPLQAEIHEALYNNNVRIRNAVLAIHRRFGKSVFAINECISGVLSVQLPNPRFFYIAPTFKQAKSIAWEYLKEFTRCIPQMHYLETELTAKFPHGGRITLLGAENFETIRGNYIDGVVLDEWGNMNPQIWREVLRPALSDRKGWVIMLGTPNGKNHFYDSYQEALNTPGWLARTYSVEDTKLIDEDELAAARATMGEEEYRQEFLCDWQAAVRGSFYSYETERVRKEGRLCTVPHASILPVDVSFDLGMDDATACWFSQTVGNEVRFINYMEWKNTSLQEILLEMSRLPYVFGEAILPFDAEVREYSTGTTRVETVEETNLFQVVNTVKRIKIEDGINAVRMIFPKCYFDETNCRRGFDALENYRKKYDPKTGEYLKIPIHDQYSHGADSMRYFATFHHPSMGKIRERAIQNVRINPYASNAHHITGKPHVRMRANIYGAR